MKTTGMCDKPDEISLRLEFADVFSNESREDIPERWDIYTCRLPSGAKSVFLFAPESGVLEVDENPAAWEYYNAAVSGEAEAEARAWADEIMFRLHTKGSFLEYCPPGLIRILCAS